MDGNQRAQIVCVGNRSAQMPETLSRVGATAAASGLVLDDVVVGYSSRVVLRLGHLEARPGERVGLVGSSGSGKTTLLSVIAGLAEPVGGSIQIDAECRTAEWRAKNTSRTLQSFPLFHWLTVRQNLALACRIQQVSTDRVENILARFSASHIADRYPKELSGGERCRASLAQSVVAHPRVLLLDEPFTGLDSLVKAEVARYLFGFAERECIPILFVTHDLHDAVDFSDRVLVLGRHPVTEVVEESNLFLA